MNSSAGGAQETSTNKKRGRPVHEPPLCICAGWMTISPTRREYYRGPLATGVAAHVLFDLFLTRQRPLRLAGTAIVQRFFTLISHLPPLCGVHKVNAPSR